jgi:hypothetical protein
MMGGFSDAMPQHYTGSNPYMAMPDSQAVEENLAKVKLELGMGERMACCLFVCLFVCCCCLWCVFLLCFLFTRHTKLDSSFGL